MNTVRKVGIVGAGIAGLTLGTALRRIGVEVHIVEIKREIRNQPGVGLSLQGNMIAALSRIEVASACLKAGVPADYLNIRRPEGSLIVRQPIVQTGGPAFPGTAGIVRSVLHGILLDAAVDAGANLRFGLSTESFESDDTGVEVVFTDGSRQRYDLLVGADGLNSKTRSALFPDVKPRYTGQSVWRAGVPRPRENFTTEIHLGGRHGVVGLCPISTDDAYVYVIEMAPQGTYYPDEQAAALLEERLEGYDSPFIRLCVPHLRRSANISFRPLDTILVPAPWYKDRVVLIGDAAHSGPPVLAQGAAMGVEDAVVLAEEVQAGGPMPQLLDRFMRRRWPRASMIVNNSVQLCEWEVNHTARPEDVGRIMRETQMELCKPF